MEVLTPGFRGVTPRRDKGKGKGVIVRWGLEQAQSESAGRRTGIPPKAGCGTLGRSGHVTMKSSIRNWGVLYKSGVYAWKVLCLTPGGLYGVVGKDTACGY